MQRIIEHDRLFAWRGALATPSHAGYARHPLCGDEVSVDVDVAEEIIRRMRFRGQGCVVSQACASMLCEGAEGKLVEDVLKATPEELMEFEIRELTMNRQRCALVGYEALMQALNDLRGPNTTGPGDGRGGDVSA
jgi:nitrogen fixation NifU-like protein